MAWDIELKPWKWGERHKRGKKRDEKRELWQSSLSQHYILE